MAWELLRTDYVDATFKGLRRYLVSENEDGSVSFHDITNYTVKEDAFFGAKDANTINTAVNAILAALENGTDLYEVFIQFFELQKTLFLEESDAKQGDFEAYITQLRGYMDVKWDELKAEYTGDIQYFKDVQENAFNVWFQMVRDQLTNDVAGHLQEQIGNLNNLETESRENLVDAINSLTLSYDETMAILAGVGQIDIEIKVLGGDSALGKNVTLHNEVTGRDVTKEYTGGILTFDACCGMEHSIHVEGLEEYTTPDMAEGIVVEEGYTSFLELTYHLKPLSELSWGKIISISEEGRANTLFRLHETKEVELKTGEKVVLEIVGFNHDTLVSDESKTAGITFGMKDCLVQNYRMNATNTNVGGWKDSEMRKTHIREHLYDVLPEELKAGIKQVNKKTSAGNKSSTIETTADDVWLFSQAELGVTGLSAPYSQEGTAYPAFTSNAERIKRGGTNGSTRNYFTRSPYVSNATQFRYITTSGGNSYANATTTSYGMAAGLCV